MAEEKDTSCAQPSAGPIVPEEDSQDTETKPKKKESTVLAKVGQKAPDFEATAFVDGAFKNIKLSNFEGKWITLCFYPGDFTFV
jgi:hypothetical protein